eukprot:13847631-Alexandrium_andersonii.AAC.1
MQASGSTPLGISHSFVASGVNHSPEHLWCPRFHKLQWRHAPCTGGGHAPTNFCGAAPLSIRGVTLQ